MIAIRKRPGERPEIVEIENELSALQKEVGGYIQAVTLAEDAAILCDEEGRLKGYAYNCNICGIDFVGTILVVGVDGEEFCDLADAEEVRKLLFPTRMTKRMGNGILLRPAFDIRIDPDDYDRAQAVLERLAAYEDTGLEPDEVDDRVWRDADVELPPDVDLKEFCGSVGEWPMYLVMISGAEFPTTLYYDGKAWFDEAYNGHVEIYRVTHWMPLPDAPEVKA